ncbi:MAG: hypothetical protein H6650_09205 [Ardenticatenales bacterium]|nr:hypothetical protein [Ardenticatenales bacterium]
MFRRCPSVLFLALSLAVALLSRTTTARASVTLSDFYVQSGSSHVTIYWETATELDNFGFHIWRGTTNSLDNATRITPYLIPSQVGGQPIGAEYEYEDENVQQGNTYFYWLEAIDVNAHSDYYGPAQGMLGGGNPLATATSGSDNATPIPTSTNAPTPPPPPQNTVVPSPTSRPPATMTPPPPTPTRPPAVTPLPTTNLTRLDTTEMPASPTPPPTPPPQPTNTLRPATPTFTPHPTSVPSPGATVDTATPTNDSQVHVVGSGASPPTPTLAALTGPPPIPGRFSFAVWGGLIAGILLTIGGISGIITLITLIKRHQTRE